MKIFSVLSFLFMGLFAAGSAFSQEITEKVYCSENGCEDKKFLILPDVDRVDQSSSGFNVSYNYRYQLNLEDSCEIYFSPKKGNLYWEVGHTKADIKSSIISVDRRSKNECGGRDRRLFLKTVESGDSLEVFVVEKKSRAVGDRVDHYKNVEEYGKFTLQ